MGVALSSIDHNPDEKELRRKMEMMRADINFVYKILKALKGDEEEYIYEAYLQPFEDAIRTEKVLVYILFEEAEGIFQKVKNNNDDQDYVEFVIGRFKTKLSRWHTLIINIIDELENGDGDSRVTDIFPKEGLEPSSDVELIQHYMLHALEEKKKPTAQRLKGGFDDIEIEKTKFCRTPISAVEMDFGFVVKDKGSMDTSYPISCNWYREISTPDCLYPITWDKVAYSGKTFTPSEDDIDKRIMVKCYVGVKGRWYLADVTITNAVIKNGLTSTSSSSCLAALHAFASPINFLKKLFPIN